MEAACRGAKEEGGLTVGLLPGSHQEEANPYVDIVIPTGLGEARNALVARSGLGAIAVGGSWGTLSEAAFVLQKGLPLVLINQWDQAFFERLGQSPFRTGSAAKAVDYILNPT